MKNISKYNKIDEKYFERYLSFLVEIFEYGSD